MVPQRPWARQIEYGEIHVHSLIGSRTAPGTGAKSFLDYREDNWHFCQIQAPLCTIRIHRTWPGSAAVGAGGLRL